MKETPAHLHHVPSLQKMGLLIYQHFSTPEDCARDAQNELFEPTPPLEGDKVEVTDAILATNLQEIEDVKATPDDLNQDE